MPRFASWLARCALSLASAGCFNPSLQPGGFSCGEGDICPDGMSCRAGLCWVSEALVACVNGGALVGKEVYACRGAFAAGKAADLCAKGYRPCESGGALTSLTCDVGFYAANATGCLRHEREQPGSGCEHPALLGCGEAAGLSRLEPALLGFPGALSCKEPIPGWRCGPGGLAAAEHSEGRGGILCCK